MDQTFSIPIRIVSSATILLVDKLAQKETFSIPIRIVSSATLWGKDGSVSWYIFQYPHSDRKLCNSREAASCSLHKLTFSIPIRIVSSATYILTSQLSTWHTFSIPIRIVSSATKLFMLFEQSKCAFQYPHSDRKLCNECFPLEV